MPAIHVLIARTQLKRQQRIIGIILLMALKLMKFVAIVTLRNMTIRWLLKHGLMVLLPSPQQPLQSVIKNKFAFNENDFVILKSCSGNNEEIGRKK